MSDDDTDAAFEEHWKQNADPDANAATGRKPLFGGGVAGCDEAAKRSAHTAFKAPAALTKQPRTGSMQI